MLCSVLKKIFLGLLLVLMPFFTFCMLVGATAMIVYGYHARILGFMGPAVLFVLSFLPIREIYKYTGWSFCCVVSGVFNAVSALLFLLMISTPD
ncbi:iron transporter [Helicobacter salomonis]|uniref:iron transporter n=1 Tax=Helicobacter salomonis TaxID=56878 RepID=UPI001F17B35A|nr:iron transporter [Helicobacter salomonis]